MTNDCIDLGDEITGLCSALGFDKTRISLIHITPTKLIAVVLLLNEQGSKFIDPETGSAAVEWRTFNITT